MQKIVKGGRNLYGQAIGIIMLETKFPRIPGDMGNATTWDFPVAYRSRFRKNRCESYYYKLWFSGYVPKGNG